MALSSSYNDTKIKDYKSALCYIPPSHIWDKIQKIRCYHDKGFVRWPPHINLLYPFWKNENNNYKEAILILQEVLSKFQPFKINFKKLNFFDHGSSFTIWLDPASPELIELQNEIFKAFPECQDLNNDTKRNINEFIPHLSLGQWPNKRSTLEAISNLENIFNFKTTDDDDNSTGFMVNVDKLALISRPDFESPFQIRYTFELSSKIQEITIIELSKIEYVASISNDKLRESEYYPSSCYYGLGQESSFVWYFAYGANLNPGKLLKRKLTPIETIPVFLPNYRLCFNVGGAMGNIQELTSYDENPYLAPNEVHGVLHKLNCFDFSKLTNMEQSYLPMEIIVKSYVDNSDIKAVAFICPSERCIPNGFRPPLRYLKLLRDGSKYWNLNPDYINWLNQIDSIESYERSDDYWIGINGKNISFTNRRVGVRNSRQVGNYKGKKYKD